MGEMGDLEELEIVGAQFPTRTSPSLILRKRRGGTAYALTLSEHQLDTIRAAGRACACKTEPAVLTLAAALGRPVVAVAIAMTAGEPPRTWMLLGAAGAGGDPAPGGVPGDGRSTAVPEAFRAVFESRSDATPD